MKQLFVTLLITFVTVVGICIVLGVTMAVVDSIRIKHGKKPLMGVPVNTNTNVDEDIAEPLEIKEMPEAKTLVDTTGPASDKASTEPKTLVDVR